MATRRKGSMGFELNVDASELEYAIGAFRGLAATAQTDKFLTPLVEATHADLSQKFNLHMDTYYNDPRLKHMFEWNVPPPAGRLWRHEFKGRGKNRLASWSFEPSKRAIPTPEERASNPDDPMSKVPDSVVSQLSDEKYVFIWKAPVMEYNHTVHIEPLKGEKIFINTVKAPFYAFVDSATVQNPGGEQTTGQFTARWTAWWSIIAPGEMEASVNREVEAGISGAVTETLKSGKSRKVDVTMTALTDYTAAMKMGREWADKNLNEWAREYRQRKLEKIIGGYVTK